MSNEWSKPVKEASGDWASVAGPDWWSPRVTVTPLLEVDIVAHSEGASAPRDVVLRLLAAEASDRLGWVWEVGNDPNIGWHASSGESLWGRHASTGRPITADDHFGMNPDELLASLHGAFMLEDALREAGG